MSEPTITTVAGYGAIQGFDGPAAALDLRQATPEVSELGRNQGVAVDGAGRVYVVATATNQIGWIDAPSSWTMQSLGEVLNAPTGALPWVFYSPSAAAAASVSATTYAGQSAIHWVATNADNRTVLYLQPAITGGATGRCSVQVVGSGTIALDLWNGSVETYSQTVTLSDTPQELVAQKVFSPPWVQFKIRSMTAQDRVEVTAFGASIVQSQVTGNAVAIAGVVNEQGFDGDGGPAVAAHLDAPTGLAVDDSGAVLVADTYNNRVRRIDPAGRIRTIAGTGMAGYDGSGPATRSKLDHPGGVACDTHGNVYIADTYNNCVRRVDGSGRISTIAGTGEAGYAGDGGIATKAQLDHPQGVALDRSGAVLIADTYNNRIRRVDQSGRITTVAGTGQAGFGGDGGAAVDAQLATPYAVAVGSDGTVYVADTLNNRIRRILGDGKIDTIVGTGVFGSSGRAGGAAKSAQLCQPLDVAVDASRGELYIVETTQAVLRVSDI